MTPSVISIRIGIVNAFIVKGKKTVIVDAGYAGNADKIVGHLHEHSINPDDVSLIFLTHGHIDHYGSAAELRKITGAPIAAHRTDTAYLKKGINYIGSPARPAGRIVKLFYGGTDRVQTKPLKVDIIFDGDRDLREFGIAGRLMHTPGHTEGSLSLILSTGEAIVGDLVMRGILRKKIPHYPLFVNDMGQLRESISKIIQASPRVIYAGHGGPFSTSALQRLLEMHQRYPS